MNLPNRRQLLFFAIFIFLLNMFATKSQCQGAERIPFSDGWKFIRGENGDALWRLSWHTLEPFALATGNDLVKNGKKTFFKGRPRPEKGLERIFPNYDDSSWENVNVPHDYAIGEQFSRNNDPRDSYLPCRDVGWYRKSFVTPQAEKDSRFYLDFDGVMSHCAVWVNTKLVGGWAYGYTSFRIDITPYLNKDRSQKNIVAVRTARPAMISRWYTGAGIYRNVTLTVTRPIHFEHWGVFVKTPSVSEKSAQIQVSTELRNETKSAVNLKIATTLFKRSAEGKRIGNPVATGKDHLVKLNGQEIKIFELPSFEISDPKLWRLESPEMYVLRADIYQGDRLLDREEIPFGIRSLRYDPNLGFFLNGKKTVIKGACLHHDLGALGAAVNVRAMERQLLLMRESGCNAIRLSHNPAAPEQLDLLDRLGFLVQAESIDEWKRPHTYSVIQPYREMFDNWHEQDLRAMIRRDRNHPSIIMYSVGNEIPELNFPSEFVAIAADLNKIVKQEDQTRPTTSANNNAASGINEIARAFDIFGYNYFGRKMYAKFHEKNPDKFVYGSEIIGMGTSRGEYFLPLTDNFWDGIVDFHQSSYCVNVYGFNPKKPLESWAAPPDVEFKAMDENPFVGGCFIWSGFDYLGAPAANDNVGMNSRIRDPELKKEAEKEIERCGIPFVPLRICESGIFDTAGFRKDIFYLYQSYWKPDFPMAHLLPHWNWPNHVGKNIPVHLFTSGDEAELFLNGKSCGRQKKGKYEYRLKWDQIRYEPGVLKAVVYKKGAPWCQTEIKTTGAPAALRLKADRNEIAADGKDLSFITIEAVDRDGYVVPTAKINVKIRVEGAGQCVRTDNGDGCDWTCYRSNERKTFNGLLLAIVKGTPDCKGKIKITANASGLTSGSLSIQSR